jgi:hypothetical protein
MSFCKWLENIWPVSSIVPMATTKMPTIRQQLFMPQRYRPDGCSICDLFSQWWLSRHKREYERRVEAVRRYYAKYPDRHDAAYVACWSGLSNGTVHDIRAGRYQSIKDR